MPPPSYISKISTRSTAGHDNHCDYSNTRSEVSKCVDLQSEVGRKGKIKTETVGLVKTLLGPSLEDAVLRTLEFGKALMQKNDGGEIITKDKKLGNICQKEVDDDCCQDNTDYSLILDKRNSGDGPRGHRSSHKARSGKLCNGKIENNALICQRPRNSIKKLGNLSKIRSLDSDLKKNSKSPEKIKRQLEALIQINKEELPKHTVNWKFCPKTSPIPMEMTVMPSFCMYQNDAELNCSSSCDAQSNASRQETEVCPTNSVRRSKNKICQAPEFISNALGPSLDVSIIDNLKMMRDIFKNESGGKGEGVPKQATPHTIRQEVRLQNSEMEMKCRMQELQKKIEELEHKERCLMKQIEEEERMRECKRKAFECEEDKRISNVKVCADTCTSAHKQTESECADSSLEAKCQSLLARIACEEEKLMRLKNQSENYRREILEAKCKKESLKRNKSLLDAWDVFASRVCHTKLPSFSRVFDLDRKSLNASETAALNCCLPVTSPSRERQKSPSNKASKVRCQSNRPDCPCLQIESKCGHHKSESKSATCCQSRESHMGKRSEVNWSFGKEEAGDDAMVRGKIKSGEIQFPMQRDICCGLHQTLKSCKCNSKPPRAESHRCASADGLYKKSQGSGAENYYTSITLESSADVIAKKASAEKFACRSKSDTSLKRPKRSKIVKVMWATARINVFQDNCRTYEIMDATCTPPPCEPVKTEGIFVVKTPQKASGCVPPPTPSPTPAPQRHCCSGAH